MPSATASTPKRNSLSLPLPPSEETSTTSRRRGSNEKSHKLAKLLRKGTNKERRGAGVNHDDWLDLTLTLDNEALDEDPIEFIEPPVEEKEKEKKTRRSIVRKTSKMFSRAQPDEMLTPASHPHPPTFGSRQPSSSSSHLHIRRPSLDSHSSSSTSLSVPTPVNVRRPLSATTFDSQDSTSSVPALSASVPTLSNRQSLPQPSRSLQPTQPPAQPQDLSSRMTSWFSHLLTSPTDPPSPNRKQPSSAATFLSAARQKAVGGMRYLMDSDAQPDKSEDVMWVMGVPHDGYRPPLLVPVDLDASVETIVPATPNKFGALFSGSSLSAPGGSPSKTAASIGDLQNASPSKVGRLKREKEVVQWPEEFLSDFQSTVWCTYRSQYAPIAALSQTELLPSEDAYYAAYGQPPLVNPAVQAAGLTTDAGWGCMLRTGQSMLANALIHLHLGRDWRVPASRPTADRELAAYAKYVQILSWFLDDPSPLCPFAVHRMALIGKQLGKEIGEWFGPSTAAGALKTLTNAFAPANLAVALATDGIVYRSNVCEASGGIASPSQWGDKAVLVLVNVRLGLDGVNPLYYESIKTLFTFPQSVGIAGGRPSSSYYFVASQGSNLFYLDPHFTRSAVPLEVPPAECAPGHVASQRTARAADDDEIDEDTLESPVTVVTPLIEAAMKAETRWYASAYANQQLRSYHCDRVKKIPLSGLDPSMLLGFICKDEADFNDFAQLVARLPQKIFAVQGEPSSWDFDDDAGLESFSEPDMDEPEDEDEAVLNVDDEDDGDLVPLHTGPSPIAMSIAHDVRPPPLLSVGSWVEPPRGGAEAPNGSAEDDVFGTPRRR